MNKIINTFLIAVMAVTLWSCHTTEANYKESYDKAVAASRTGERGVIYQQELEKRGFDTLHSRSAIIPLLVGDEEKLGTLQMALFNDGIFSNIGTTPAVKASKCRLRLNVMATHTLEQLAWAAETIERHGKKLGII